MPSADVLTLLVVTAGWVSTSSIRLCCTRAGTETPDG